MDLAAGLAVTVFAFIWIIGLLDRVVMPLLAFSGVEIKVPELRGMPVMEAQVECARLGLEFVRGRVRVDNAHPPGTIIDQFPPVGARVKPGRRVEAMVSVSDAAVLCPDVAGKSPREASLIADSTGLVVNTDSIRYRHSNAFPAGVVIKQSPAPLAQMKRGEEIKIWVSLGAEPKSITAPDLVGKSLDDIKLILTRNRLVIGAVARYPQRHFKPGVILAQDPPAGAAMQPGSTISVRIAVSPVTESESDDDESESESNP